MLRYMTSGESHGRGLVSILEGMPSGLAVDISFINAELSRRMVGYGRSERMRTIEKDAAQIISGLKKGVTLGSPIAVLIENRDSSIEKLPSVTQPRPGHADLAGALKYNEKDIRNILERASARDTASRVALGAIAKLLLGEFDVEVISHVIAVGGVEAHTSDLDFENIKIQAEKSSLRCADKAASKLMEEEIEKAERMKDTLGGVVEVIIKGVVPGLGSFMQWNRRLDARLALAVMSIPAVKGISVGAGFDAAKRSGSAVHDAIYYDNKEKKFFRKTNNAGGLEGGVTNGEDVVLRAAMKPIATLAKPLDSVDLKNKSKTRAAVERADVSAVPSCGVVAEAACALEIADAFRDKFGGDSLGEMKRNFEGYAKQLKEF